jgi:hypothetical protein
VGGTFDPAYGYTTTGTANNGLSLDVSGIAALQVPNQPWMVYFEIEKSIMDQLPPSTGLTAAALDAGSGLPLVNSSESIIFIWPGAESFTPNGQLAMFDMGYAAGTGAKSFSFYSAGTNICSNNANTAVQKLDGELYVPFIIAYDSGTLTFYYDGTSLNFTQASIPAGVANGVFQTIVIGRRNTGSAENSLATGHVRNLMVISGRTPYSTKSYGIQTLTPSSVFSNVQNFGDSYSQVNSSAPPPIGLDRGVMAYLGKYGLCIPNCTEQGFTLGTATGTSNPGRRLVGWSSTNDSAGFAGTVPVGASATDTTSYTTSVSYLWNMMATFLALNPTCVIFNPCVNDFGVAFNEAAYARWLKYYLERFYGLNGNPSTSVKAVVLVPQGYPPYMTDGFSPYRKMSARQAWNACVSTIAWFQRTYPALASSITLADNYTATGGENQVQQCWLPLAMGNIHQSSIGKYIQGVVWAQGLMNLSAQMNGNGIALDVMGPIKNYLKQYQPIPMNQSRLIGHLRGANFNVTTDQAIYLNQPASQNISTRFVIDQIIVTNPNTNPSPANGAPIAMSMTTAAGGIYTGAGKTGTTIVAAAQSYATLTGNNIPLVLTLAAGGSGTVLDSRQTLASVPTTAPLYFALTAAQGTAAYADIYVFGRDLT